MQTKILNFLRSPAFFTIIMVLFLVEAVWIALSAAYPMVFDENTQFGIIQLHAQQWSPIFTHQPAHAGFAGAITRDPSYLYHYLLSFPYRLLSALTTSQMVQVIGLRLINVAFFATGLVLFRRLLLKTKVSPAIVNVTMLFFILTPVVPLLAGQINYDNLVLPVTAAALLMATAITDKLEETKRLPGLLTAGLLATCLLGSLVQFVFLPIFVAICAWLAWRMYRQRAAGRQAIWSNAKSDWHTTSRLKRLAVSLPLIISLGLFLQMYGVNVVKYHNPVVQCNQVLSDKQCSLNAAWERNHTVAAQHNHVNPNPVLYGASWSYRMFVSMFYTSSGGASPSAFYLSVNPLPVIFAAALTVFGVGSVLFVVYRKKIFEGYEHLGFLLFASTVYVAAVWFRNYHDFVQLGAKVAINGRYLFPVALPCMIILALAFRQLFGHRAHLKVALLAAVFVLFLQGGGILTYLNASNGNWYWHNKTVVRLNKVAQQVVKPLIVIKTPVRDFGQIN